MITSIITLTLALLFVGYLAYNFITIRKGRELSEKLVHAELRYFKEMMNESGVFLVVFYWYDTKSITSRVANGNSAFNAIENASRYEGVPYDSPQRRSRFAIINIVRL